MTYTRFFEFHQNNSGGSFDIDDARGIGPNVWIEARDATEANYRAIRLGIYFNGCAKGKDCDCCGDRWYEARSDDEGKTKPEGPDQWSFWRHDTIYIHRYDGTIERVRE